MKTKLLAIVLLAGSAAVAGPRVRFGVGIGAPVYGPAPVVTYAPMPVAPMTAYLPPAPGPGYFWTNGYWAPRPYAGVYRVAPRPYAGRYYAGRWRR